MWPNAISHLALTLLGMIGLVAGGPYWTYCGKVFHSGEPALEPEGRLAVPLRSTLPLLDLVVFSRMNVYTEDDKHGIFVIDAQISHTRGLATTSAINSKRASTELKTLLIDIKTSENTTSLVQRAEVVINSTGNEFKFSLDGIPARLTPYNVSVSAMSQDGRVFSMTTDIFKLPSRRNVVKLDNKYGGLWVPEPGPVNAYRPLFPYAYYVDWDGWLKLSLDNLNAYKAEGYNLLHIVPNCDAENHSFNFTELIPFLDHCDRIGMYIQYDMRCTYSDTASLSYQLDLLSQYRSLLLWYTADEPDGPDEPVNAVLSAYHTIKRADPYHPISLVLTCADYNFQPFTSATDIVQTDTYPIGTDATFSPFYRTSCNATYGNCGCDNCLGVIQDVAARLDTYAAHHAVLGGVRKPRWAVVQAFGEQMFWKRYPTGLEVLAMQMLAANHGAKGIVNWLYPTREDIMNATAALAKVVTGDEVTGMLLGGDPMPIEAQSKVDAALWKSDTALLVSVVSLEANRTQERVEIMLPSSGFKAVKTLFGSGNWTMRDNKLVKSTLGAFETCLVWVQTA